MPDGTYITRVQAKAHCRIDFSDDDTYIDDLIALVEELILTEIQGSIAGEGTVTTAGAVALVGVSSNFTDYIVGDTIKVEGETLRTIATITDDTHLTVTVAFSTTNSALTYVMHPGIPNPIPEGLKHAMLLMIGHFYQNREVLIIGVSIHEIPFAYKMLVEPFKNYTIC